MSVAFVAACVLGYFPWLFWTHTNTYQIWAMIRQGSSVVITLGDDGITAWADALAFSGRQNDALAFSRKLRKEDEKTAALAAIAVRVVERGDPDRGYSIFSEALVAARQIPENVRMERYIQLIKTARALALKGRIDLAVRVLDTLQIAYLPLVPIGNNRSNVARSIAEEYITAGRPDSAKGILLAALPEATRDRSNWSQVSLAVALGRVGEKERAAEVLKNAELDAKRNESEPEWSIDAAHEYMSVASAYRILGMTEGQRSMLIAAIDAARKMKSRSTHFVGYNIDAIDYFRFGSSAVAFVRSLVRNGRADGVDEFIIREGYPLTRIEMRVAVSEALQKADPSAGERYIADAEKEAGLIEDNELRAEAFCALAQSAIQSSKTDRAFRFLDGALAASRGMREEYDSVNRRDFSAGKAHSLARISLLLAEAGRISESVLVAHEAEKASSHIAGDPSYYLPRISRALANSGDIFLARQTADRATDGSEKLEAYAAILQGLTIRNEVEAARSMGKAKPQGEAENEW